MKNILITGGSGFIGKNLINQLSVGEYKLKYNIFAPSHKEIDLLDKNQVMSYAADHDIDRVIHCANVGGNRKTSEADTLDKNLRMFFNICALEGGVERIIHFGSGAEYDKSRDLVQVKEEEFGKYIPKDAYGFSKYIMSQYIEKSQKILCLRLFGVFGKYEDYEYKFISNAMVKNLLGVPINIIKNVYFDYLYVDDCIKAVIGFLENTPKSKILNLASGIRIDLYTLANYINECGKNKVEINIINDGLNKEYTASNAKLIEETGGITITPHKEAVRKMFAYYESIIDNIDRNAIIEDRYVKRI